MSYEMPKEHVEALDTAVDDLDAQYKRNVRMNGRGELLKHLYDDMWEGEPAFVLAGGPSFKQFLPEAHRLVGHGKIIAVNRSLEVMPEYTNLWCFGDRDVWKLMMSDDLPELVEAFDRFNGVAVTKPYADMEYGPRILKWGVPPSGKYDLGPRLRDGGPCFGGNTGFWAMNFAYCLGCNPIIMFGLDARGGPNGKQAWWHDGYRSKPPGGAECHQYWRTVFQDAYVAMTHKGVLARNCSPGSAVDWPIVNSIDEVLDLVDS
jgi:hypothetical protein